MRTTNLTGLPEPLVAALRDDGYSRGQADISATGLIAPPRKVALEERHADALEEDAADMAAILIGKSVHAYIAAKATGELSDKKRLMMVVNGWVVSGQTDHVEGLALLDDCSLHGYNTTHAKKTSSDSREILEQGGGARAGRVLAVDGGDGSGVRIHGPRPQPGGGDRGVPPSIVGDTLRGNPPRGGRVPPLRQQEVRQSGTPIRRNAGGEHVGRAEEGEAGWQTRSVAERPTEAQACSGHRVVDWKSTSVNEWKYGLKEERAQQLNIYAELLRANGYTVTGLSAILIFKDWSATRRAYEKDYPPHSIMEVEVPLWPQEQAQAFILERVLLHQQAREYDVLCTDEERWLRVKHAVVKGANKRATRLFETAEEAEQFALTDPAYRVEVRGGEPTRCLYFCSVGRMGLCQQWNGEQ